MSEILTWPERPTCHGNAPTYQPEGCAWREPHNRAGGPYVETFRTCSYCGSIHPEDLLRAVNSGATLGGSDWKYGWPHKFYVEGIPNPVAGQMRPMGTVSAGFRKTLDQVQAEYPDYQNWRQNQHGGWQGDRIAPAPSAVHAKWYNEHLRDLNPAAFAAMSDMLFQRARVRFEFVDGRLRYSAPHAGYQA